MPWRDPPTNPGPVIVFDIDGVVATMIKFEHLLGDRFDFQEWSAFHKRYKYAALISRGARLVDDAVEDGLQVVWSTTRPDHTAPDTWEWLQKNNLPTGHIMNRHRIKDGTRPALDVKLRHWHSWRTNYWDRNPIVGWVEDDDAANDILSKYGCPTWRPKRLQRAVVRNPDQSMIDVLASHGRFTAETLAEKYESNRYDWERREAEYQAQRHKWWQAEQERVRIQRAATRSRQEAGRAAAERRRQAGQ